MKTFFYLFAFCYWMQSTNAQISSYQLDEMPQQTIVKKDDCSGLKPVYYNFSRRRLYTNNKMPLNHRHFLELCRGINDPGIQHQIRKYDQLTSNKKKLIGAMIFTGVAGYITTMGSMVAVSGSGRTPEGAYTALGIGLASLFIVTPALAISTSLPHQKRKEILFRDLPDAYNFYVVAQANQ